MTKIEVTYEVTGMSTVEIDKPEAEITDDEVYEALWEQSTLLVGQERGDIVAQRVIEESA